MSEEPALHPDTEAPAPDDTSSCVSVPLLSLESKPQTPRGVPAQATQTSSPYSHFLRSKVNTLKGQLAWLLSDLILERMAYL